MINLFDGVQPIGFQEERERLMESYHRDIAPIYQSFCGDDGQFRSSDYELFQALTAPQLHSLERAIMSLKEKYGLLEGKPIPEAVGRIPGDEGDEE